MLHFSQYIFCFTGKMGLCGLLVLCIYFQIVCSQNPGLRIRLTEDGLNYANKIAVDDYITGIKYSRLEDVNGDYRGIQYRLSNLIIKKANVPKSYINLSSGSGVIWGAQDFSLDVEGSFQYKLFGFFSGGGDVSIKLSKSTFAVGINIGLDPNGKPTVKTSSCNSRLGSLKLNFRGKKSWVYNIIAPILSKVIVSKLETKVCERAKTVIDKTAEKELCKLKLEVELGEYLTLDYTLLRAPSITSQYIEADLKGEVYWTSDRTEAPFAPPPMATVTDNKKMVYVTVSDYLFNTMAYQAYHHGLLLFHITRDSILAIGDLLNTTCSDTCIGKLIPQIGQNFPNSQVEIIINSTDAPRTIINEKNLFIGGSSNITFVARKPDDSVHFLFSMDALVESSLKLKLSNSYLIGKIQDMKITINITKSAIGTLNETDFQNLLDDAVDKIIMPLLNDFLEASGLPIPSTDEMEFKGSKVELLMNTILVATDIKFKTHPDGKIGSTVLRYLTLDRHFPTIQ